MNTERKYTVNVQEYIKEAGPGMKAEIPNTC
jgi:hypothetical protein